MRKRGKYGHGRVYQPTYRTPDGTVKTVSKFYIQYYDRAGQQHREPTNARTEKEARGLLAIRLGRAQQGNGPVGEKSLRYGDIRESLLHAHRVKKSRSLEVLSNGDESLKGLTKLDEFFGFVKGAEKDESRKVATITGEDWEKNFVMARRKEGVSDATIANSAKVLRHMLRIAVDQKRISAAPSIYVPKAPRAREEFLAKEQFDTLLEEQFHDDKDTNKEFRTLLKFLFYQGVRIEETMRTTWSQFDLDAGVFTPNPDINKTSNGMPKSLHKEVVVALRAAQKAEGPVFELVSQKMFEKALRKAMLKLGFGKTTWQCSQCRAVRDAAAPGDDSPAIACPNCKGGIPMQWHYVGPTPHCLRASAVVFYRESGMSDAEIMAITGHSNTKTFLGYSRTRNESIKQKMDVAEMNRDRIKKEDRKSRLLIA